MSDYTRVYHPSLSAWQDVPKDKADEWKASGWLKTKPAHVDDSAALPPGEGYQPPAWVDVTGTAAHVEQPAPAKAADKK